MYLVVKRTLDILIALVGLMLSAPIAVAIAVAIKATSRGPVLFWSERIGQDNEPFQMPKFRTMQVATPLVATHLLRNPKSYLTPIGGFLRRSSLDEIPQLWSVLKADMSFVGPRPALLNQYELIRLRTVLGIHHLRPGITGWAQINGRDEISITDKVALDNEYLVDKTMLVDIKIFFLTFSAILSRRSVSH